jgi:manganese transport protein
MYRKILVAVENSRADEPLLAHIACLAARLDSELLLLHVADGFAARNFDQLTLNESEEMRADKEYLEIAAAKLRGANLTVSTQLALGNPPQQILKVANDEHCDLIAMAGHGHKFIGDLIHGSTINEVRHATTIPVLLVRAGNPA